MKLEIELSEQDVIGLSREAIEREIQVSIKRLRLRAAFNQLSEKIRDRWEESDYWNEVELARTDAWESYRKEIGL